MALFYVISASTGATKYSGKPTYHGTYLSPSYLEFTVINSPTPIAWEIGDYIVYSRTGLTYKLYSIPQPTKKTSSGTSGEGFSYVNVQFFAETKKLEICPFRDLVIDEGQATSYHFSTLNSVDTYEDVAGVAARIQKNLDNFFGSGTWDIAINANIPASYAASEARAFSVSGGSCLDALAKVYEVWPELGWIFKVVNGVNTIEIGTPNVRTSGNTTNEFKYGTNGLTMIKKTQVNKDEMATRLFVYGSQRNIISRYYNGKDIYEAENVYIPNLMLPLANWGTTSGKPDASKAYLDNVSAQSTFGIIPKTVYFDGNEQEEIYPSIERATVADVRSAKQSTETGAPNYYPASNYTSSQRIDEVTSVSGIDDDGLTGMGGTKVAESATESVSSGSGSFTLASGATVASRNIVFGTHVFTKYGKVFFNSPRTITVTSSAVTPAKIRIYKYQVISAGEVIDGEILLTEVTPSSASTEIAIPEISFGAMAQRAGGNTQISLKIEVEYSSSFENSLTVNYDVSGGSDKWELQQILTKTFTMNIRQIGFDMMARASLSGNDRPVIAFKDGDCIARSFEVKAATYHATNDFWTLEVYRGDDTSVGMRYPNTTYRVKAGDHFVLLNIAMPDEYVGIAANRLLAKGQDLLAKLSGIEPFYEPSIDAKAIAQNLASHPGDEAYILREGKYMHIKDNELTGNADEYVLIDTLTINENECNIPTYAVTLREKKRVSFTQSIENAIQSLTSTSSGTTTQSVTAGTNDYNNLNNIPSIDGQAVIGNLRSYIDLGLINSDFFELDTTSIPGTTLIKAKFGLYSVGILSAGGVNGGSGGAGGIFSITIDNLRTYVTENEGVVNLNLTGYLASKSLGLTKVISTDASNTPLGVQWTSGGITITGTLAASSADANAIYLVPNNSVGNNTHDEYIVSQNSWELIGSTQVDLTGYLNTSNYANTLDPVYLRKDYHGIAASQFRNELTTACTGSKWELASVVVLDTPGLFPHEDYANAILFIDRYYGDDGGDAGKYNSQLGFNSLGDIYYRAFSGALPDAVTAWKKILHTGNFIAGTDYIPPTGGTLTGNLELLNCHLVLRGTSKIDIYADSSNQPDIFSYTYGAVNNRYIYIGYGTSDLDMDTYFDGKVMYFRTKSGQNKHQNALMLDGTDAILYRNLVPDGSKTLGTNSSFWAEINASKWYPNANRNISVEYNSIDGYFKVNGNLVATGYISAGGVNPSGGSGGWGVSSIIVGSTTYNPVDGVVTLPEYPTLASLGGASATSLAALTSTVNGKIDSPAGGSVGNVLKKTASGAEWAAETQGTVTSVKFNGGQPISPTSGVVDLGNGFLTTSNFVAGTNYQAPINSDNKLPYSLLSGTPIIPPAVTEGTVSGWGFTKNTGTYSKPSGGIPYSDLSSTIKESLDKADTAIQSHQSLADYSTTTQMNSAIRAHHDATKADASALNNYLPKTGGTISGNLSVGGYLDVTGSLYSDVLWIGDYGKLTDGNSRLNILSTSNKNILVAPDGTGKFYYGSVAQNNEVATVGGLASYLPLTGGLLTGNLVLNDQQDAFANILYRRNDASYALFSHDNNGNSHFGNSTFSTYVYGNLIYFYVKDGENQSLVATFGNSNFDIQKDILAKGGIDVWNRLKFEDKTDIHGAYLSIHPERGQETNVLPFFSNDLAFLVARGGTVHVYTTSDTTFTSNAALTDSGESAGVGDIGCVFDGSSSYFGYAVDDSRTKLVIDIKCPAGVEFAAGTMFYIDFGNNTWKSSDITVLKGYGDNDYVVSRKWRIAPMPGTANETESNNLSFIKFYEDSSWNGHGFNKIRIVLVHGGYAADYKTIEVDEVDEYQTHTRHIFTRNVYGDAIYQNIRYFRWDCTGQESIYTILDGKTIAVQTIYKLVEGAMVEQLNMSITDYSRFIMGVDEDGLPYAGGAKFYHTGISNNLHVWREQGGSRTVYTRNSAPSVNDPITVYVGGETVAYVSHFAAGEINHRIAEIGCIGFNSELGRNTFMSRGYDDYLYRGLTPGNDGEYNLGSSAKRWKSLYVGRTSVVDNVSYRTPTIVLSTYADNWSLESYLYSVMTDAYGNPESVKSNLTIGSQNANWEAYNLGSLRINADEIAYSGSNLHTSNDLQATLGDASHRWLRTYTQKLMLDANTNANYIDYDSANGCIKIHGNLVATGFISAGGVNSHGGGSSGVVTCENKTASFTVNDNIECYFVTDSGTITLPASPATGRHFKVYLDDDTYIVNPNGKTVFVILGKSGSKDTYSNAFNLSNYSDGNDGVYDFIYDGQYWYVTPIADTY